MDLQTTVIFFSRPSRSRMRGTTTLQWILIAKTRRDLRSLFAPFISHQSSSHHRPEYHEQAIPPWRRRTVRSRDLPQRPPIVCGRLAWDEHGVMHVVRSSHQPYAISRGIHHSSSASRRTSKFVANSLRDSTSLPVAVKSTPPIGNTRRSQLEFDCSLGSLRHSERQSQYDAKDAF